MTASWWAVEGHQPARPTPRQEWVKASGAKVCVVFEGRDTAGKAGTIKRIVERVSPGVFRVVALPAPTIRDQSQMYIQRYLPYGLEVGPDEQTLRLESRIHDPRKVWKLTAMDLKSYSRWYDYSRARDAMFAATDTPWAPCDRGTHGHLRHGHLVGDWQWIGFAATSTSDRARSSSSRDEPQAGETAKGEVCRPARRL